MRPSEIITLYLATAAPVGVAYFLRRQAARPRVSTATLMATAAGVALAWPLTLTATFLGARRLRFKAADAGTTTPDTLSPHEAKIERAKRLLLAALREVEDLMQEARGGRNEQTRQALFEARESAERYTGLALACDGAEGVETAAPRELELWRAAGRTGEDLQVAARCVGRRNATRLDAHRNSARTELLHALAEVRELADSRPFASRANAGAARRLSEAILEAYGRAIELLSLLEDQRAAMSVARLLDAECARLRRLETFGLQDARESAHAGESCTTPLQPPLQPAPTSPLRRPPTLPLMPTHR